MQHFISDFTDETKHFLAENHTERNLDGHAHITTSFLTNTTRPKYELTTVLLACK